MNEYDSDKMLEILNQENYQYTDEVGEADLILLNTCSVRDKAEQKFMACWQAAETEAD